MTLLMDNRQSSLNNDGLQAFFEAVVRAGLARLELNDAVEVSLILTDNEEIRRLNSEYRGVDQATDVLSFPMLEPTEALDILKDPLPDYQNPDTGDVVLGDIIISVEKAISQANEYGHSVKRELGFLMVHGLLHLLGFDHEKDKASENEMFRLQEEILGSLGLTRPE